MPLDLRLIRAPATRIGRITLEAAVTSLRALAFPITTTPGPPSKGSREEEMIQRLKNRRPHESFAQVTQGVGRERILLSLYTQFTGQKAADWLPPFNSEVASSVLGARGGEWHPARRRQASQLFFTHLDRLPALGMLCDRLRESHDCVGSDASEELAMRHKHRLDLFTPNGPDHLAKATQLGETLIELMDRFAIPREVGGVQLSGRFAERLKECFLLSRLKAVELGGGQEILKEIQAMRDVPYQPGVPMGAAALRILTQRTLAAGGTWKDDWADWLLKLGSDPALPNSAEFRKWWSCWNPTPTELECARRGLNRKTLEYFIRFLEASLSGTDAQDQFTRRSAFLRWLDESGKIRQFKLLLHPNAFEALPREYRQHRNRVARLDGSHTGASVIVFQCVDDVWIVEGTHSFAIRMFRGNFPVAEALAEARARYDYAVFTQGRMHKDAVEEIGIYKRHQGDWETGLLWKMQWAFRIEPPWRYR